MTARRGLTLMELVVSLALTGVMAALGAAAFGQVIDARRGVVAATSDVERAAALRDQVRKWLLAGAIQIQSGGVPQSVGRGAAAVRPAIASGRTSSTGIGTTGSTTTSAISAAAASGDELDFTTTAPNPADAPSARMRLFIDADANTPESGLTLEYQAGAATPLQRVQLEAGIGVLTVEFLDQRTNRWYTGSQAAAITPIALRVSMHAYDGGRVPGILEVPMVIPMGALVNGQ
jgi:prepilin-type N-terminal cleavage/methylation domain-containing protein